MSGLLRPRAALGLLALLGAPLWLGCPPAPAVPPLVLPPASQSAEAPAQAAQQRASAAALLERVRAAHRLPTTVTGDAKAFVDAPENGGRYGLLFTLERPASLRIDALMPWGEPAATLVAHQGRFALRDERNKQFLRGRSTPRNLARLLPAPLRDEELVALFCGALPELLGGEPFFAETLPDGRSRLVTSAVPDPRLATVRGYFQEALFGPDLRLLEVRRSISGPTPELVWVATLDEHDDRPGALVPRLLHLHLPAQTPGGKDIEIDLRLKNEQFGKPPPASAFTLVPPAGMELVELE